MTPEQAELRAERIAIMQTEGVPEEAIRRILVNYPELYGREDE